MLFEPLDLGRRQQLAQSGTDELAQIIRKKWTMLSRIVGGRQGVPAKLAH